VFFGIFVSRVYTGPQDIGGYIGIIEGRCMMVLSSLK